MEKVGSVINIPDPHHCGKTNLVKGGRMIKRREAGAALVPTGLGYLLHVAGLRLLVGEEAGRVLYVADHQPPRAQGHLTVHRHRRLRRRYRHYHRNNLFSF